MGASYHRCLTAAGLTASLLLAGCSDDVPEAAPPVGVNVTPEASATGATDRAHDGATHTAEGGDSRTGATLSLPDLRALGEEMTAALASGDVESWLALTDLEGAAEQQQRDWFANVQAVPMEVREMHPILLVRTDDGAGGATAQFAFRHQVSGVDRDPVLENYEMSLVHADGRWSITEVVGATGAESVYPLVWDLGPIEVSESAHAVVLTLGPAPSGAEVRSLDAAVAGVLTELPADGVDRVLIEYADAQGIADMLLATGEEEGVQDRSSFYYAPLASPEVELAPSAQLPDVEDGEFGALRLIVNRDIHEKELEDYRGARGGVTHSSCRHGAPGGDRADPDLLGAGVGRHGGVLVV